MGMIMYTAAEKVFYPASIPWRLKLHSAPTLVSRTLPGTSLPFLLPPSLKTTPALTSATTYGFIQQHQNTSSLIFVGFTSHWKWLYLSVLGSLGKYDYQVETLEILKRCLTHPASFCTTDTTESRGEFVDTLIHLQHKWLTQRCSLSRCQFWPQLFHFW